MKYLIKMDGEDKVCYIVFKSSKYNAWLIRIENYTRGHSGREMWGEQGFPEEEKIFESRDCRYLFDNEFDQLKEFDRTANEYNLEMLNSIYIDLLAVIIKDAIDN